MSFQMNKIHKATAVLLTIAGSMSVIPAFSQTNRPRIEGPITLQAAIHTGLKESRMLAAARLGTLAAKAETRSARSALQPSLSTTTSLSAGDMRSILNAPSQVMPAPSLQQGPGGSVDQNLMLMVPISTGGRLQNLVRSALHREQGVEADLRGSEAETAYRIREAYGKALLGNALQEAASARFEAAKVMLETTRARIAAGKDIEASGLRIESEVSAAERALTSAQNEQQKALIDLKYTMGVRLDSPITLTEQEPFSALAGTVDTWISRAKRERPELAGARARREAARYQTRAAQGSQRPQIYGTLMGDAYSNHDMGSSAGYTVGVMVSIPLLDGGQRRAETAGARAMESRSQAELEDTELRTESEVMQAWLDLQTAGANVRSAEASEKAVRAAYETIALRVANQKGILVEQLDALAARTEAGAALAQAQFEQYIATARLYRVTGVVE